MDKTYIAIYGAVNTGKSTLINKLAGQDISIVSPIAGTTTDPVKKTIELAGLGPCVLIDTAGFGDNSTLGAARMAKSIALLDTIDIALIVINNLPTKQDMQIIQKLQAKNIPFLVINNKQDLPCHTTFAMPSTQVLNFSQNAPIAPILQALSVLLQKRETHPLLEGLVKEGATIILVMPIDAAAPKGRLILPQVSTLRAILDAKATAIALQPEQLVQYLATNAKPDLIITDSQAFKQVVQMVPQNVPLTSFSILLARQKADFNAAIQGAAFIDKLKEGDKVLILESCSHSANTCDDIGRIKLPALLSKKTGKKLSFTIVPGLDQLPADLNTYALAVQCGGCMVSQQQLKLRLGNIKALNIPISNYGIAIAHCTGILPRVIAMFK